MRILLLFLFGFLPAISARAQPAAAQEPLRLLMIGNSFSWNASRYLDSISADLGHALLVGKAEISGAPLQQHWDSVMAQMADSNRGKPYNGQSLKTILQSNQWDYISIQQSSLNSGYLKTYEPFAASLVGYIREYCPGAKILVHQTWPYRADAIFFTRTGEKESAKDFREMWVASRLAYHTIATRLHLELVPVGDAFYAVAADSLLAFRRDPLFLPQEAVYPQLPEHEINSLHAGYTWTADRKLNFDPVHANDAGCYLAGLVWIGFMFRENPLHVNFRPRGLDPAMAAALKGFALSALQQGARPDAR